MVVNIKSKVIKDTLDIGDLDHDHMNGVCYWDRFIANGC